MDRKTHRQMYFNTWFFFGGGVALYCSAFWWTLYCWDFTTYFISDTRICRIGHILSTLYWEAYLSKALFSILYHTRIHLSVPNNTKTIRRFLKIDKCFDTWIITKLDINLGIFRDFELLHKNNFTSLTKIMHKAPAPY